MVTPKVAVTHGMMTTTATHGKMKTATLTIMVPGKTTVMIVENGDVCPLMTAGRRRNPGGKRITIMGCVIQEVIGQAWKTYADAWENAGCKMRKIAAPIASKRPKDLHVPDMGNLVAPAPYVPDVPQAKQPLLLPRCAPTPQYFYFKY